MSLHETVLRAIVHHRLISPGVLVVVAVSGGADSLALLHILNRLRAVLDCDLHVATFDHQLRGSAGAEDAQFVEHTARQWGLPVTSGWADVAQLAHQHSIGIEAAARQARYTFLATLAHKIGAAAIAVAHHADDQAETILMHLLRGAGLAGLRGMAFRSPLVDHPDLTLIRPLLLVARAEIELYCREHGLSPREDITNRDTAYLRNYLRWEILPNLRRVNPMIDRALLQLADVASVEGDYLDRETESVFNRHVRVMAERVMIDRAEFQKLHPALQRRLIYRAVRRLGAAEDTGYQHIVAAVTLGVEGQVGSKALLPGGIHLRVDYEQLMVEREDAPPDLQNLSLEPGSEFAVNLPGVTPVPGKNWLLRIEPQPMPMYCVRMALPPGSALHLRTRRRGDRFAPLGMGGHSQRLAKWMIDHKVPQAKRDYVPLLIVNGQIAAILLDDGWIIGEHVAVRDEKQSVFYATYEIFEEFLKARL